MMTLVDRLIYVYTFLVLVLNDDYLLDILKPRSLKRGPESIFYHEPILSQKVYKYEAHGGKTDNDPGTN